jgi:hypothetical protein
VRIAVPNQDAAEVLQQVLGKIGGANWEADKARLRAELAEDLTDDLFSGEYEFVNVPRNVQLSEVRWVGQDQAEITVQGFSLPDKAALVRGVDGRWRVKSYLGQCTGCLGTARILDRPCRSCSSTGWGLRPS